MENATWRYFVLGLEEISVWNLEKIFSGVVPNGFPYSGSSVPLFISSLVPWFTSSLEVQLLIHQQSPTGLYVINGSHR